MRFNARRTTLAPLGVSGTARVGRPASAVLPLVRPGDVAVIDQVDLDRDTATALVDAGVRAVVNAAPMISGRYANLGPEVLAEAGVLLVDLVGQEGVDRIADDQEVRVHDGVIYAVHPDGPAEELATGRALDLDHVHSQMEHVRGDLAARLDSLAHTTSEFFRREHELLEGRGLPRLTTTLSDRPVVVVARADHVGLSAIRAFVREQAPVVIVVGEAADDLLGLSWVPDIVIVTAGEAHSVPSPDALRLATDVVLIAPSGSSLAEQATIEAVAGSAPLLVDTAAAAEDLALLLAGSGDAGLVVGVGLGTRLEDFLDGAQSGRASSFAARLTLGDRLVDATAVRSLYADRSGPSQVALVAFAGLVALVAAISVTPVGQDWAQGLVDHLQGLT